MNKSTMNCDDCGRMVSRKTAGKIEYEISDWDGKRCISGMLCGRCAEKRGIREKAEVDLELKNMGIIE